MGLEALLSKLEARRADTSDTPCNLSGVSGNPAPIGARTLDTPDTPINLSGNRIAPDAIAAANDTPGETPIPADLENLIRRAGTFWEYSPEDYEIVHDLARHDPEGLRLALESDKWLMAAEREAFEERAAIMEYEGGLSRAEAEALAAQACRTNHAHEWPVGPKWQSEGTIKRSAE
ncbi:MAG TPA: hypothetical protein PLW81_00265 [Thiobacillaceae bacterium]|nr:hypothetical protein [Thiobacillaceae bacterium]